MEIIIKKPVVPIIATETEKSKTKSKKITKKEAKKIAKKEAKKALSKTSSADGGENKIGIIEMKVELTLLDPMLGTKPGNTELLQDYIMSKKPDGPDSEENFDPNQALEKGTTVFWRAFGDDNKPAIFDYMIKGFFKDAQGCLNRVEEYKMQAHKKVIDGLVFIKERVIELKLPENTNVIICERPLRTSGPQGERVALSRSEEVPEGTKLEFTIQLLDAKLKKEVITWLDYGRFRGLGQWRNSGKGRFSWKELD